MQFDLFPNHVDIAHRSTGDGGGDTRFDRMERASFPLSRTVDLANDSGPVGTFRESTGTLDFSLSYASNDSAETALVLDPEKQYRITIEEVI